MNIETKKYSCPRLIDYVIIVGSKDAKNFQSLTTNTKNSELNNQHPELLRRYPLNDHSDFNLPNDVTYFCQPEGCFNYIVNSRADKNLMKTKLTSFIFTLTEKDSARVRYGICINFYRKNYHQTRQQYKKLKLQKKNSTTSSESSNSEATTSQQQQQQTKKSSFKLCQIYSLTSLCIITHHPFFTLFRECINILHRIIDSCNQQSELHLFESVKQLIPLLFGKLNNNNNILLTPQQQQQQQPCSPKKYLKLCLSIKNQHKFTSMTKNNIWNILTGTKINEHIFNMLTKYICEIETWILRLLSAPVPIPGKTKVIVSESFLIDPCICMKRFFTFTVIYETIFGDCERFIQMKFNVVAHFSTHSFIITF